MHLSFFWFQLFVTLNSPMLSRIPRRFVIFAIVGISGIVVNTLLLWMGTDLLDIPYQIASLFAIQCAIVNNYVWNRRFTWRDRSLPGRRPTLRTFGQFTLVSWIAGALNWLLLILLTEWADLYYLFANLIAIFVASLVNYLANDLWTFRSRSLQKTN